MYKTRKIKKYDVVSLYKVLIILRKCGKDMKVKYGLEHWHNSWIKDIAIMSLCALSNSVFLVEDLDKNPIATYQSRVYGEMFHLSKLATDPKFSGKGVGSFCIETAEENAKARNCNRLSFEVYEKSQHAINFYKNRGYKIVGNTDTLKYKEFVMEKEI